jgi:hypothetical protein
VEVNKLKSRPGDFSWTVLVYLTFPFINRKSDSINSSAEIWLRSQRWFKLTQSRPDRDNTGASLFLPGYRPIERKICYLIYGPGREVKNKSGKMHTRFSIAWIEKNQVLIGTV